MIFFKHGIVHSAAVLICITLDKMILHEHIQADTIIMSLCNDLKPWDKPEC